jgi:hypothetical protein
MWKRPRFILLLVTVAILGWVAWWRIYSEPKEPQLSISEGARLRIECAGVSIQPEPGWGITSFDPPRAGEGKPQLCSPGLTRTAASVTTLLMPKDGAPLRAQAEAFTSKLHLEDVRLEGLTAPSGLPLVHATGISAHRADGGEAAPIRMDAFFFDNQGRMAVIYELAMADAAERFVAWFVQTVRMDG